MIQLELSDAEASAMDEALESYLSDLRMEIAATDHVEFREGLKQRRDLLQSMLQRVKAGNA